MRRRVFVLRLHLVAGLVLSGALVLVGLSGAVLVFRAELDEALQPAPAPPAGGGPLVAFEVLVDAAQRQHPSAQPRRLVLPEGPDRPARVSLRATGGDRIDVLVDPSTARVLTSRWLERSPLHALHVLHAELYLGKGGSLLVALLGVGLLVQGATGLYLWWPFLRRPARGFTIRWWRPWRVVMYDVHKAVGACSLAFNLPVALTGTLLALAALAPSRAVAEPALLAAAASATLAPSLDVIAHAADQALPGGAITAIRLATTPGAAVIVQKRLYGELDPRGASVILVDPIRHGDRGPRRAPRRGAGSSLGARGSAPLRRLCRHAVEAPLRGRRPHLVAPRRHRTRDLAQPRPHSLTELRN